MPEVKAIDFLSFGDSLLSLAIAALPRVAAAFALLLAGLWLARAADRGIAALIARHKLDATLQGTAAALARYTIMTVACIAALQQIGVETASILATLGAIAVAIGLALQGTLANLAAGFMLLWFRPFRVGDMIETSNAAGRVCEVGLFASELRRADGAYVFVPNTELWNKPVTNLSRMASRMIDLKFTIRDPRQIASSTDKLLEIARSATDVAGVPPKVLISGISETGTLLSVQLWVTTARFQEVSSDVAARCQQALGEPYANG